MSNEILEFIYSVPPVTRVFLLGTIVTTFGSLLSIVPLGLLINYWPQTISTLQLWRPVTAFFVVGGNDPMSKLMEIYMFYSYSKDLEMGKFKGVTSDYVYYMLLMGFGICSLNIFLGGFAYMAPLLVAVTYTWSQETPDRLVSFYFGIVFKAKYLPGFLLAFKLLIGGQMSFLIAASGAASAYLYSTLEASRGPNGQPSTLLQTPRWLQSLLPGGWSASTGRTTDRRHIYRSFGSAYYPGVDTNARTTSSNPNAATGSGSSSSSFRWGRGHRLGD
ncbi:Der1-like family-domain-containing protein [Dipodascopsis uninucleata]